MISDSTNTLVSVDMSVAIQSERSVITTQCAAYLKFPEGQNSCKRKRVLTSFAVHYGTDYRCYKRSKEITLSLESGVPRQNDYVPYFAQLLR